MTAPVETETDATVDTGSPADTLETSGENAGETPKGPGREAAKYRVERNAAREALTATQGQLQQLQTREVLRLAGDHLSNPADLLGLGDVELADLLGEDGFVNPEAVAEVAAGIVSSRPGLAKNPVVRATDTTQGAGGTRPGNAPPGWDALFKR
jgi:hypothetical protein